jgi:hypothetical protein
MLLGLPKKKAQSNTKHKLKQGKRVINFLINIVSTPSYCLDFFHRLSLIMEPTSTTSHHGAHSGHFNYDDFEQLHLANDEQCPLAASSSMESLFEQLRPLRGSSSSFFVELPEPFAPLVVPPLAAPYGDNNSFIDDAPPHLWCVEQLHLANAEEYHLADFSWLESLVEQPLRGSSSSFFGELLDGGDFEI